LVPAGRAREGIKTRFPRRAADSSSISGAPAAFANVCFQAGWFRPCSTNRPVQILVQPGQLLFSPKSGFRGSGCRISAGFRISAHSPIEKPRSILLRFLLDLIGEDSQKWRKPAYPQIVSGRNIVAIYTKRRRLHEQQFATDSLRLAIAWFNVAA